MVHILFQDHLDQQANMVLAIILCAVVVAGMCMLFFYGVKYGKEIEDYFVKKSEKFKERRAAKKAARIKKKEEKAKHKDLP